MAKPRSARRLLTASARVATLVVMGVAETACNIQVRVFPDAGPRPDAGPDAGDAGADAGDPGTADGGAGDASR